MRAGAKESGQGPQGPWPCCVSEEGARRLWYSLWCGLGRRLRLQLPALLLALLSAGSLACSAGTSLRSTGACARSLATLAGTRTRLGGRRLALWRLLIPGDAIEGWLESTEIHAEAFQHRSGNVLA